MEEIGEITLIRTYSELSLIDTLEERFEYLKLNGRIGELTFGYERYLNQLFYKDPLWKTARRKAIMRDSNGSSCFDLGLDGYPILGTIFVHHINPISKDDILNRKEILFDLENLVCCSQNTHNAVHYGDKSLLPQTPIERFAADTCPWKRKEV